MGDDVDWTTHFITGLCKLQCFPPVALAWDDISGLHIYPNLNSDTLIVDSAPAQWSSTLQSDKTFVLLLVDPRCSYKGSISISVQVVASRLSLLYIPKIFGFSIAVIFYALMWQAYSSNRDMRIPSMLTAMESNLTLLSHFFPLAIAPIFIIFFFCLVTFQPFPPFASFISISLIWYIFANGVIAILSLIFQLLFYGTAEIHTRWHMWEWNLSFIFPHWFLHVLSRFISLQVVRAVKRVVKGYPLGCTAFLAFVFVCFGHPALGLLIPLVLHMYFCHNALCSFLTASRRSSDQNNENFDSNSETEMFKFKDLFHHLHGLFILYLIATLMFAPSLVAWYKGQALGKRNAWGLDWLICVGVIFHGVCNLEPKTNSFFLFGFSARGDRVNFVVYLIAGYWSYYSGMASAPHLVFYSMAIAGGISLALTMLQTRNRDGNQRQD